MLEDRGGEGRHLSVSTWKFIFERKGMLDIGTDCIKPNCVGREDIKIWVLHLKRVQT